MEGIPRIILALLALAVVSLAVTIEQKRISFLGSATATVPEEDSSTTDTLIIGSGITGSAAAFYLDRNGVGIKVAESESEVGGTMVTRTGSR